MLPLWVRHHPNPVLLDLALPGLKGVALLKKLRASHPEAQVLMLTASEDQDDALAALDASATGPLARRELQVLGMVSEEVADDDIGARLGITERTVRAHVVSAKEKLGAANTTHAVALCFTRGLLGPGR